MSRALRLDECDVQKAGFSCFYTVTGCLLKLLGYHEHCVYSERVCYHPNPGLAILPGPGFPTPGKPGLGNNAFLAKVGNNGQ